MKRYPRTFLQLVTWSYVLISLPLLLASGYVVVALDTMSEQYRAAIDEVSISSRLSSELTEDLVHMERNLRRYEVLRNEESLGDYTQARSDWIKNLESFAGLTAFPGNVVDELHAQLGLEAAAYSTLRDSGDPQDLRIALDEIKTRSEQVLDEARLILDRERVRYLEQSDALRTRLLLATAFAIVLAVLCLWLARRLLSRLIGRFEKAVLALGRGNLHQPIALDGPGDLRWLGRWLEWLRKRLLSLEEGRVQVLRHVSHELKTPLAAMNEGASLLAEQVIGSLTPEQLRIVGILQGNSRRLQELIEGLLRLQQAGHAAERIGHQTLRFDRLIAQVIETWSLIAGERGIRFEVSLPDMEIVAGEEALVTIVHNLLSNAVKFSPDGGCIRVLLREEEDKAILDVFDQGAGVPEQESEQIFEPFYRSRASQYVPGVGLGLAIAREFVVAHRGQLLSMPEISGGHFRLVLPLRASYLRTQQYV